jgi:hypothetical protein
MMLVVPLVNSAILINSEPFTSSQEPWFIIMDPARKFVVNLKGTLDSPLWEF